MTDTKTKIGMPFYSKEAISRVFENYSECRDRASIAEFYNDPIIKRVSCEVVKSFGKHLSIALEEDISEELYASYQKQCSDFATGHRMPVTNCDVLLCDTLVPECFATHDSPVPAIDLIALAGSLHVAALDILCPDC